jgi:outer membrane murein-binding lipoprotein Lpp
MRFAFLVPVRTMLSSSSAADWKDTGVPSVESRVTHLEARVEKMDQGLKQHFTEFRAFVVETLSGVEQRLGTRIDHVDAKVDRLNGKVNALDAKVDRVDAKVDALDAKVDRVDARVGRLETKFDHMGAKVDLLLSRVPPRKRAVRKK